MVVSATCGWPGDRDTDSVLSMPGVVEVLSHLNAPSSYGPHKGMIDPAVGERLHVLHDDQVRFYGQPVAVVVADTLDHAERAVAALRVTYAAERPVVDRTTRMRRQSLRKRPACTATRRAVMRIRRWQMRP